MTTPMTGLIHEVACDTCNYNLKRFVSESAYFFLKKKCSTKTYVVDQAYIDLVKWKPLSQSLSL